MPGYLLLPDNAPSDLPIIIYIVGATGFKEAQKTCDYGVDWIISKLTNK